MVTSEPLPNGATLCDAGDNTTTVSQSHHDNHSTATRRGGLAENSLLHDAVMRLDMASASTLIREGHQVNAISLHHGSRTPLDALCLDGNFDISQVRLLRRMISLLITHGADPTARTRGKSAIFLALDNRNPIPVVIGVLSACTLAGVDLSQFVFLHSNARSYSPFQYVRDILAECARGRHER